MRRLTIPGADILTDIATEEMMTDTGSILFRNFAAQFDRRVRNALPAVENIGFENGARRTGIDAARAGPAAVRDGSVVGQFKIGNDATKKQPRAGFLIDDTRILSEPAHARILRIDPFEEWAGIDIGFRSLGRILLDPGCQLLELPFDRVVIVLTPGVS